VMSKLDEGPTHSVRLRISPGASAALGYYPSLSLTLLFTRQPSHSSVISCSTNAAHFAIVQHPENPWTCCKDTRKVKVGITQ
jgi:hypothetical protein